MVGIRIDGTRIGDSHIADFRICGIHISDGELARLPWRPRSESRDLQQSAVWPATELEAQKRR
jgi:hypothetical protein